MVLVYCEKIKEPNNGSFIFIYYLDKIRYQSSFCNFVDFLDEFNCDIEFITHNSYNEIENELIKSKISDIKLHRLSSYLSLPIDSTLYDIFSYYFDSDGEELTDLNILNIILSSILMCNNNMKYIYCMCFLCNFEYSFTWFYINDNSYIKILDSSSFILDNQDLFSYKFGNFKKLLRYKVAKLGYNIKNIRFLTFGSNIFSNYLSNYIDLLDILSSINGINSLGYKYIVRLLSNDIKSNSKSNSLELVTALQQSSVNLGLKQLDNGEIYYKKLFRKDYSICTCNEFDKTRGKWGIILDCEGNRNNEDGLRELGGIIFCRYKNILLNVDSFECNEILLEETLQRVIKNFEEETGRYIPNRGINVYTFGGSDESMIDSSLRKVSNKQFRRKICKIFKFYDCRNKLYKFMDDNNITFDDKSLSGIAQELGVYVVFPKHSAISDSRTLFNILAFILQDSNIWILD